MKWEISQNAPKPPVISPNKKVRKGYRELKIKNLTLITPMLGGGTQSLKVDRDMPIRVQSIRGQLRFWWRTFQVCSDINELRKKENDIWGCTESASKVNVSVEIFNNNWKTIPYQKDTKPKDTELPKYVIFPLDGSKDEQGRDISSFEMIQGGGFHLSVSYDSVFEEDIINSLKLWILFGGLGARTRRGMGTVYSPNWPGWKNREEIIQWLHQIVLKKDQNITPQWPSLIDSELLMQSFQISKPDINGDWKQWVEKYQNFRQYRIDKNTGKKSPYGKSIWPESKSIRDFDANPESISKKDAYFPRGAYGLPIQFLFPQFKNIKYTLYGLESDGSKIERWASPFILKIFKLNDKTGLKICLKLKSPFPCDWLIEGDKGKSEVLPSHASPMAKNKLRNKPPLSGKDPYAALFNYLDSRNKPVVLGTGGEK